MSFTDAIRVCFSKYAEFNGRASRAEFWWFWLFSLLVGVATGVLSHAASGLASLLMLLPSLAVAARRLHDTNRSAWWLLLWLIPVIGWIVLLIFTVSEGTPGDNPFGARPAA